VVGDLHADSRSPSNRTDSYSQTVKDKLNQINEIAVDNDCETVIQTGDVFHRTSVPTSYVAELMTTFKQFDLPVWSCAGNHDLQYGKQKYLDRSPLNLLFKSNALIDITSKDAKSRFKDEGLFVDGYHFQKDFSFTDGIDTDLTSVFVGHQYNSPMYGDTSESLKPEESSYDITITGHDHSKRVEQLDNTLLICPGAVTRLNTHEDTMNREPTVVVLDTEDCSYEEVKLDVEPAEEVFDNFSIDQKHENKSVDEFVESMNTDKETETGSSVIELLESYDVDDTIESLTREYLAEHNLA
jgi:DNA repair exonuclease SbcCD nuclease subunit